MRTLNELALNLKETIIKLVTENERIPGTDYHRCNNLKLSMDPGINTTPHVIVNMGMSEAMFNLRDFGKISGSLGPEEKYVARWFNKPMILEVLRDIWREKMKAGRKSWGPNDGDENRKVY
ncbi:MAG: hypothetical protein LBK53_04830 [Heliobacteriaceae bacterium]|jgi:hypothetical protein|nr:hypothetical protein [Heliobacteriaceae bacterium]